MFSVLPSQVHPSYPYGNPNNIKHPSAKPRHNFAISSRALFEDMGYGGGGTNGTLRWTDLALHDLLPVDAKKEEAQRAMQARKMASGTSNNNPQTQQPQAPTGQLIDEEEEGDEEGDGIDEDEDDNDNTGMFDEDDLDEDA